METIIHIGAPKTGTSALQSALFSAKEGLKDKGILYPTSVGGFTSHSLAAVPLTPGLSRGIHQFKAADPKRFQSLVIEQTSTIRSEVERFSPKIVILSSEYFFANISYARDLSLFSWLREISDSFTILVYLRRPSDWYLSKAQQLLKASSKFIQPAFTVRQILNSYEDQFPGDLSVRAYEKNKLKGGDIVLDFAAQFVPDAPEVLAKHSQRINEMMSAEAMSLLQEYRKRVFPNSDNVFNQETNRITRLLMNLDPNIAGYERASLKPEIEEAINQGSSELIWLAENYGVTFENIDYRNISAQPFEGSDNTRVEDICNVKQSRRFFLSVELIKILQDGLMCGESSQKY